MGRTQKGRVADLSKALLRGTASLRDSLWLLNEAAPAEVVKEDWGEVKRVADKVAKEATTIGILWTQGLKDEDANQALKTYFEGLQALLLLCHACTVGAGPTLLVTIRDAAQQVVNASLTLLTRAVSFSIKGTEKQEREAILPAHVGSVWEACNTLKRTPYTNRAAVGRSIAQVATSVKNILQKVKQIKEGQSSQCNACDCCHADDEGRRRNEAYSHHTAHSHSHGDSGHDRCSDDDSGHLHSPGDSGHGHCELGHSHSGHKHCRHHLPHLLHNHSGHPHSEHENGRNNGDSHELSHSHDHCGDVCCGHGDEETSHGDGNACVESLDSNEELSEEEMAVVEAARHVVECSLDFIKQLLYVAAEVLVPQGTKESSTGFLENVLKHCKGLGVEVDKLGAYLHPPQQTDPLHGRIMKMETLLNLISTQVRETRGSIPEGLDLALKSLQNAKTELFMLSSLELQEALKLTSLSPP
jgi:hypothetical protein